MTDVMLDANAVVRHLVELAKELQAAVNLLRDFEIDAVQKRHTADIEESHAYLAAEGSVELRKHTARIAADKFEEEALVAEAVVRHLRAKIRTIELRVEIGRSMGTALRAELRTLPGAES